MSKNFIYLGEQSIFAETVKRMVQTEGGNFYDYASWDEVKEQFSDLAPNFLLIDIDTFELDSVGGEVRDIRTVIFSEKKLENISWNSELHIQIKPLDVLQFREYLQGMING